MQNTPTGLNFRVAIDGAMIIAFVFSAGAGWMKLNSFEGQLSQVQNTMAASPMNSDRLARVEEKLDRLIRDLDRLQAKVDR